MQSGNHPTLQEQLAERAKKEETKLDQHRQVQKKERMTLLYDDLYLSLNKVKNGLKCTFNPKDCEFYRATFTD